ncbi:MAG TPA: hypothetical protein VGL86_08320, partial [Polyangia bacterium]
MMRAEDREAGIVVAEPDSERIRARGNQHPDVVLDALVHAKGADRFAGAIFDGPHSERRIAGHPVQLIRLDGSTVAAGNERLDDPLRDAGVVELAPPVLVQQTLEDAGARPLDSPDDEDGRPPIRRGVAVEKILPQVFRTLFGAHSESNWETEWWLIAESASSFTACR